MHEGAIGHRKASLARGIDVSLISDFWQVFVERKQFGIEHIRGRYSDNYYVWIYQIEDNGFDESLNK